MINKYKLVITLTALVALLSSCKDSGWQSEFNSTLTEYGHRNWIVVADYAYPSQNSTGIKTIVTDQNQIEVLSYVLEQINSSPHVKPILLLDKELEYISEQDAPGIDTYKSELNSLLNGREVSALPHENIIQQLDDVAGLFKILILKTNMTIPYTSVFVKLDCRYWDSNMEERLRNNIADEDQ